MEEARELLASTRGPARRGAAERLAEVAARLDPGAAEPDAPPAIRFTPPPPPPEPELPPAPPARLEVPVTLAADVSGLDVLGDPPGSLADAALASWPPPSPTPSPSTASSPSSGPRVSSASRTRRRRRARCSPSSSAARSSPTRWGSGSARPGAPPGRPSPSTARPGPPT